MLNDSQLKPATGLQLDAIPDYCVWDGSIVRTKMLAMIWSLVGDKEVNILDVGCGEARMWRPILENIPNISLYGFDPSPSSVLLAEKELDGMKANIRHGDVIRLETMFPEAAEFDLIVSHSVLEHVVPREVYFGAVSKRLKNNGVALISWGSDHFRQGVRTDIRNVISRILAKLGIEQYYAAEVDELWAKDQISKAGLDINLLHYYSLVELKKLFRLAKGVSRRKIFQDWICVEEEFNCTAQGDSRLMTSMDETFTILTKK